MARRGGSSVEAWNESIAEAAAVEAFPACSPTAAAAEPTGSGATAARREDFFIIVSGGGGRALVHDPVSSGFSFPSSRG